MRNWSSRNSRETAYATYCLGLFFDDTENVWQPTDFRHVGLHRTAGYILGVDPAEEAPRLALPDDSRPIDEPYVCIAVQSSSGASTGTTRMAGARWSRSSRQAATGWCASTRSRCTAVA